MDKNPIATLAQILELKDQMLTVTEISELFGVHPETIRRWEKKGHLKCLRHPVNNYRLFNSATLKGNPLSES